MLIEAELPRRVLERFRRQRSEGVVRALRCRRCSVCSLLSAACGPKAVELPPPAAARRRSIPTTCSRPSSATSARRRRRSGTRRAGCGCRPATSRPPSATSRRRSSSRPASIPPRQVSATSASRRKDLDDAATHFDRAVVANPRYVPALVGRGEALLGLGEREHGAEEPRSRGRGRPGAERAAHAASRCCASAACRTMWPMRARRRKRAGWTRRAGSTTRRIAASPDSPFLYREVADVARRQGDLDTALAPGAEGARARTDRRPRAGPRSATSTRRRRIRQEPSRPTRRRSRSNRTRRWSARSRRCAKAWRSRRCRPSSRRSRARRRCRASSSRRSSACGSTGSSSARRGGNAVVITDTRGSWAARGSCPSRARA